MAGCRPFLGSGFHQKLSIHLTYPLKTVSNILILSSSSCFFQTELQVATKGPEMSSLQVSSNCLRKVPFVGFKATPTLLKQEKFNRQISYIRQISDMATQD